MRKFPKIKCIDHVHVYVTDLEEAKAWYSEYLGFQPVDKFESWNKGDGPLTMGDDSGHVHIALFKSKKKPSSAIAFGSSGENFIAWLAFFESKSLSIKLKNHGLSWSMYFNDPYGNNHEITTYDFDYVKRYKD